MTCAASDTNNINQINLYLFVLSIVTFHENHTVAYLKTAGLVCCDDDFAGFPKDKHLATFEGAVCFACLDN